MLVLLLTAVGWTLAHTPEWCLRGLTVVLGEAVLWLQPRRRVLIRSNLHHAYPGRPRSWHRRMARTCCRRMVETGLLSLATPYLGESRIRRMATLAPSAEQWARARSAAGAGARGTVFATLHLALWESQTWFRLLSPVPLPEFGIIFRPLDLAAADVYVKRTRERFGMRLLSRRGGFAEALRILRGSGCVGVLFDQNAGMQGALTTFLGRVCSTTELPGLLAAKLGAEVRTFYPRRTGFWRVVFESDPVENDGTAAGITLALNRWLEKRLEDEALAASWLWVHDRWRHQDIPASRLRLESKRDLLAADLKARGLGELPRRTRVWVRLPNWLGDVVMAVPLLRALRASRPDAEITLLAKPSFIPLLSSWGLADRMVPLPARGFAYGLHFLRMRGSYPDVWLLLTNSIRGDIEAWLAGCPQRFGIQRPGRLRPLLTHAFRPAADSFEGQNHQLRLWEAFFRHFGLEAPLDCLPLPDSAAGRATSPGPALSIGLIPGSENEPSKRWPVEHWRQLIDALPDARFVLFGTSGDTPVAAAIAAGLPPGRLEDLAGRTDLPAFAARLRRCRLLVTNDTGGMHLANAMGVPVIGLFGPTNPLRTGPVFDAPHRILMPPGSPPTGGGRLADLPVATVAQAVLAWAR